MSDSCTTANKKQAPDVQHEECVTTHWMMGDHDMLTTSRSIRPTCGGSSTARECGTAAKALYTCLTFNPSNVSGDGARGCMRGRGSRAREWGDRETDRGQKGWNSQWETEQHREEKVWSMQPARVDEKMEERLRRWLPGNWLWVTYRFTLVSWDVSVNLAEQTMCDLKRKKCKRDLDRKQAQC